MCIDFFFIERGVVWEETIILLPDNVHYVFLSATIPNARQFAEWISHLHKQVSSLNTPVRTQERLCEKLHVPNRVNKILVLVSQ